LGKELSSGGRGREREKWRWGTERRKRNDLIDIAFAVKNCAGMIARITLVEFPFKKKGGRANACIVSASPKEKAETKI